MLHDRRRQVSPSACSQRNCAKVVRRLEHSRSLYIVSDTYRKPLRPWEQRSAPRTYSQAYRRRSGQTVRALTSAMLLLQDPLRSCRRQQLPTHTLNRRALSANLRSSRTLLLNSRLFPPKRRMERVHSGKYFFGQRKVPLAENPRETITLGRVNDDQPTAEMNV